jgi:membrane protein DedA with SNARE-associated domain
MLSESALQNSDRYMRKVNITASRFLAVLLWLPVVAASETSVALVPPLAPVESVSLIAAAGVSTALSGDVVRYRKEHIELREIFYATFAFSAVPSGVGGASTATADYQQSPAVRDFERSLAKAQPLLERYGYGAAFAAVMAEGMGIPTPGQTLLMAGALEAAQGRMNIVLLVFLVTTAAALGNSVGYAIGRWGGRVALDKLKVNPHRQEYLDDLFKRRGGLVILLARFLDGLRQLNGIVSGVMRMPWWTFTAYNVAGAILWTCTWGLGTYYLGRDIHVIAGFFHRHRWVLYVLGGIALVALVVYLLRFKRKSVQ